MKLIVFGATGATGQEVVKQALQQGMDVTAFVRSPSKLSSAHPNLEIVKGDAFDKDDVCRALPGHDAVISCLGSSGLKESNELSTMTENILDAMKQYHVERIAYTASAGINREIPGLSGIFASLILRNVLSDHRRAVELIQSNDMQWTIARPMQLTNGVRTTHYRTSEDSVPTKGKKISRSDVAHFLLESVSTQHYLKQSIGLAY
ncbi:epimerase [Pontibacillus halophilus JSM 076056 = DSM 19796]|uniref:Epimerase n=1 Tax=Pontibacillus halophilus JSM 076056 = DSM 19796 TaxID=1385510 RepID=A0A0A5GP30_9BACI|nr:NAD(P)-binding oxidoreductase [Pontibacillus halophilus]KGX93749.1 epimerase [Pontibacillus halophilus JSM 076056 = DSM 19796]